MHVRVYQSVWWQVGLKWCKVSVFSSALFLSWRTWNRMYSLKIMRARFQGVKAEVSCSSFMKRSFKCSCSTALQHFADALISPIIPDQPPSHSTRSLGQLPLSKWPIPRYGLQRPKAYSSKDNGPRLVPAATCSPCSIFTGLWYRS